MSIVLAIALSYLVGSIPTGLWLGLRLRGIDIREHGSKNIGSTNTMRVLGKTLGAIALAGDAGKGVVAVLVFARLGVWEYLPQMCGVSAILGHMVSVFLGFRGGKGVATGAGVYLALCPIPTAIAAGVFAAVVYVTRMVSAGSIAASVALCAALYAFDFSWPLRGIATATAVLVIYKHRTNIARILKGNENRI